MNKKIAEGCLSVCKKEKCPVSCCDDVGVEEWVMEYLAFHDRARVFWESKGIKFKFKGDRVGVTNCSTGKECKFLKYSLSKDYDQRPIDCKIYPYFVDWEEIDFNKKKINLYFADFDCPLTKEQMPPEFKDNVSRIIKRDFSLLFFGADFEVIFHDQCKYDIYKTKRVVKIVRAKN